MPETLPVQPDAETSRRLQTAIRQFNAGDYFTCHETLEELWLDERGTLRLFYQGVLMIGVGLHHLQRHNLNGGRSLLERGSRQLQPFAPACHGVDVGQLICDSDEVLRSLEARGLEATLAVAGSLFPRIRPAADTPTG